MEETREESARSIKDEFTDAIKTLWTGGAIKDDNLTAKRAQKRKELWAAVDDRLKYWGRLSSVLLILLRIFYAVDYPVDEPPYSCNYAIYTIACLTVFSSCMPMHCHFQQLANILLKKPSIPSLVVFWKIFAVSISALCLALFRYVRTKCDLCQYLDSNIGCRISNMILFIFTQYIFWFAPVLLMSMWVVMAAFPEICHWFFHKVYCAEMAVISALFTSHWLCRNVFCMAWAVIAVLRQKCYYFSRKTIFAVCTVSSALLCFYKVLHWFLTKVFFAAWAVISTLFKISYQLCRKALAVTSTLYRVLTLLNSCNGLSIAFLNFLSSILGGVLKKILIDFLYDLFWRLVPGWRLAALK